MSDPRRLRDGGDDFVVASLLDAARAYRRPVASRNRIMKVLGLPVAISVGVPATAIASALGTKMVIVVSTATVLIAGGGAVAYRAHVRAQAHEQAAVASHRAVASRAQRQPGAAPGPSERPAAPSLEDPPAPEAPAPPIGADVPLQSRSVAAAPNRRQPSVRRPRALSEPLVRNAPPVSPAVLSEPETPALPKPTAPPRVAFSNPESRTQSVSPRLPLPSAVPAAVPPPRRAPLAREIALLDAAERAERQQDHRAALARLEEYGREFPDGALLAEAEVLRISALLGGGDAATARARARAFLAAAAPSPLTARVAAMLSRASRESREESASSARRESSREGSGTLPGVPSSIDTKEQP